MTTVPIAIDSIADRIVRYKTLATIISQHLTIDRASGVEWSRVEWSGVEWSGVECVKDKEVFQSILHIAYCILQLVSKVDKKI